MRQKLHHIIIYIAIVALLIMGCTGNGGSVKHVPQVSDTLYTEKAAMDVYGTQPERALEIIDYGVSQGLSRSAMLDMSE